MLERGHWRWSQKLRAGRTSDFRWDPGSRCQEKGDPRVYHPASWSSRPTIIWHVAGDTCSSKPLFFCPCISSFCCRPCLLLLACGFVAVFFCFSAVFLRLKPPLHRDRGHQAAGLWSVSGDGAWSRSVPHQRNEGRTRTRWRADTSSAHRKPRGGSRGADVPSAAAIGSSHLEGANAGPPQSAEVRSAWVGGGGVERCSGHSGGRGQL
jgi:hypothetical protein